jgi:hypothetical protein
LVFGNFQYCFWLLASGRRGLWSLVFGLWQFSILLLAPSIWHLAGEVISWCVLQIRTSYKCKASAKSAKIKKNQRVGFQKASNQKMPVASCQLPEANRQSPVSPVANRQLLLK